MTILEVLDTLEHIIKHDIEHNLDDNEVEALTSAQRELIHIIKSDARNDREVIPEREDNLDECVEEMAYNLTLSVVGTLCSKEVHEEVVKMLKTKIREADT